MPQYLFHVVDDDHAIDDEGNELSNLDAARAFAVEGARDIMANEIKTKGEINLNHWIEIEDEYGDMTVVTFGNAVKVRQ